MDKRVHSMSLYHTRQCCIILTLCSVGIDYTLVFFMMHNCRRKLWKQHQRKRNMV